MVEQLVEIYGCRSINRNHSLFIYARVSSEKCSEVIRVHLRDVSRHIQVHTVSMVCICQNLVTIHFNVCQKHIQWTPCDLEVAPSTRGRCSAVWHLAVCNHYLICIHSYHINRSTTPIHRWASIKHTPLYTHPLICMAQLCSHTTPSILFHHTHIHKHTLLHPHTPHFYHTHHSI